MNLEKKSFIMKKVEMSFERSFDTSSKRCHPRANSCCEYVNDELAGFVRCSSEIFRDTVEALGHCDLNDKECRLTVFTYAYNEIYNRVIDAMEVILCSRCAGFCCESAASAVAKVALAFLSSIASAVLNPLYSCSVEPESQLQVFVDAQLQKLDETFLLILSTVKCSHKKRPEHDDSEEEEKEEEEEEEKEPESDERDSSEESDKDEKKPCTKKHKGCGCGEKHRDDSDSSSDSSSEEEGKYPRFVSILRKGRKHEEEDDAVTTKHYRF